MQTEETTTEQTEKSPLEERLIDAERDLTASEKRASNVGLLPIGTSQRTVDLILAHARHDRNRVNVIRRKLAAKLPPDYPEPGPFSPQPVGTPVPEETR